MSTLSCCYCYFAKFPLKGGAKRRLWEHHAIQADKLKLLKRSLIQLVLPKGMADFT
jgi:hypothetical protein